MMMYEKGRGDTTSFFMVFCTVLYGIIKQKLKEVSRFGT